MNLFLFSKNQKYKLHVHNIRTSRPYVYVGRGTSVLATNFLAPFRQLFNESSRVMWHKGLHWFTSHFSGPHVPTEMADMENPFRTVYIGGCGQYRFAGLMVSANSSYGHTAKFNAQTTIWWYIDWMRYVSSGAVCPMQMHKKIPNPIVEIIMIIL